MFGAAAMSLSSFCVVTNALRLNMQDIHNAKKDKPQKKRRTEHSTVQENQQIQTTQRQTIIKEEHEMKKTMKIEGMMCGHCEANVKKCLEALPEVEQAEVSHEAGTAVVTLNGDISEDILKKAVEDQDYKVVSIS